MASIQANTGGPKGDYGWQRYLAHFPATPSSEATKRIAIFCPGFRCDVGEIAVINSNSAITGANTDTVHLNVIDGGPEGAGTTEVANRDLVLGTDLPIGKTLLLDAIKGADTILDLGEDDILEFETEEVGTGLGAAIGALLIAIVFRPSRQGK